MQKIELIDGYVIFPKDWIVVDYQQPNHSRYVGVIEILNGIKYNTPHFIFCSEKQINEITLDEESTIIVDCIRAYPLLRDILSQYVPLERDDEGEIVNGIVWSESPQPGCCGIADYGTRTNYPYGAMIVRVKG